MRVVAEVAKRALESTTIEAEGVFIAKENFERLTRLAVEEVNLHHRREPLARGLARETLRERLFAHAAPEIFRASNGEAGTTWERLVSEKDMVRSSEHGQELSAADEQLRKQIAQAYEKAALAAPTLDQALVEAGVPAARRVHARKILQLLIDDGTLVRVQGEMFFYSQAIENLKALLRRYATEHEPDRLIDVPAFKDLAGVSRKYAIPLLEYFDRERITQRAGDKRVILK